MGQRRRRANPAKMDNKEIQEIMDRLNPGVDVGDPQYKEILSDLVDDFITEDRDRFKIFEKEVLAPEIAALPQDIQSALQNMFAAGGGAKSKVVAAMVKYGYPQKPFVDVVRQGFFMNIRAEKAKAAKGEGSEGTKKVKTEASAMIKNVAQTVGELKGGDHPLLTAWLAAQSPKATLPLMPYKGPSTFEGMPYRTWMSLGDVSNTNVDAAKKALDAASKAIVGTTSADKQTDDGSPLIQLASPEGLDETQVLMMPIAGFKDALEQTAGMKRVQAQLWATFWDGLSPATIKSYMRTPSVLPADAWIALGARIGDVVPNDVRFGEKPTDGQMNALMKNLRAALEKAGSGADNAKKAVSQSKQAYGLPPQMIDTVKGEDVKDFTEPVKRGARTWDEMLDAPAFDWTPLRQEIPKTFFERTGVKSRGVDDRGILMDLGQIIEPVRQSNPKKKDGSKKKQSPRKKKAEEDEASEQDFLLAQKIMQNDGVVNLLVEAFEDDGEITEAELSAILDFFGMG